MIRHVNFVWLVLLVFIGSVACQRGPTNAPTPPSAAIPATSFFNGVDFLAPDRWADSPASTGPDASSVLASLHISEVVQMRNETNGFPDGVRTHAEWDPTRFFLEDMAALRSLGTSAQLEVEWRESLTKSDPTGSKTDLVLSNQSRVYALSLAAYFSTLAKVVEADGLTGIASDLEVSNWLLWIGYHVYSRDHDVASLRTRLVFLQSAWGNALRLRARHASASGDEDAASRWGRLEDEMRSVIRALQQQ